RRHRRHLHRLGRRGDGAPGRHAGRGGQRPRMDAGRIEDRVRLGDDAGVLGPGHADRGTPRLRRPHREPDRRSRRGGVHRRPAAFSSASIYPIDIWTAKGALVLEPNYRGSAGYGEAFRSLNVRNLGVGDAWDVLSGIDHLIKEGIADPNQVGTMGWSQGGYISAFLTTHDSARFKAVSVGAGISDWMTYYVNTDITQFTRHYLKATPWDDPEIYAKTSPITYVKTAKAPTLIQHGATDQRVPPPNAFQLY